MDNFNGNKSYVKKKKKSNLPIFDDSLDSFHVNPLIYNNSRNKFTRTKSLLTKTKKNFKSNLVSEKHLGKLIPNKKSMTPLKKNENIFNLSSEEKKDFKKITQVHKNILLKIQNYDMCCEISKKKNELQIKDLKILEDLLIIKKNQKQTIKNIRKFNKIYNDIEVSFKEKATEEMLKKIEIHKSQLLYLYKNLKGGINEEINRTLAFMPNVLLKLKEENRELKSKLTNSDKILKEFDFGKFNGKECEAFDNNMDLGILRFLKDKDSERFLLLGEILKEYHTIYLI